MTDIGEIHGIESTFEWRIKDFFLEKEEVCYSSHLFSFDEESWYLNILSNGQEEKESVGYISLYLWRESPGPPKRLMYSFHLKTSNGRKYGKREGVRTFEETSNGWGYSKLWKRSTLLEKKSELVPSDVLTIVCTLKDSSECSNNAATEKLVEDLKGILDREEHSDVIVKVRDEKFRLHRNILAGRSPYFNSMFNIEMKEKSTGIVTIDDCEPDIFRNFIRFLYTGKVETLSPENVCDLYEVADKYQEDQLKEECLCFMKYEVCADNFCDFTVLALKHNERELLNDATDLFCKKTKEIIQSTKWQTFLKNYPTQANELFIKTFNFNVK